MSMIRQIIIKSVDLGIFYAACWAFLSGGTDLDWMVNAFYLDMWNGSHGVWYFDPWFSLPWWWAYIYSITRLIAGSMILGIYGYRAVLKR